MPSHLRILSLAAIATLVAISSLAADKKSKAKSPRAAMPSATPTVAKPADAPAAPTPQAAPEPAPSVNSTTPSPASGKWVSVLADGEFLKANPGIAPGPNGAVISGLISLLPSPARNCGVRVAFDNAHRPKMQIALRYSDRGGQDRLSINERGIKLLHYDAETKKDTPLLDEPISADAPATGETEVELVLKDNVASLRINSDPPKQAEGAVPVEGQILVSSNPEQTTVLKKLQYVVLE